MTTWPCSPLVRWGFC